MKHIILVLKELNQALEHDAKENMKILDLTPSQSFTLDYLLSQDSNVYATQLHEVFKISKSAISSILKGLKNKGYLKLENSSEDERKKIIILTDKAYQAKNKVHACLIQLQKNLCLEIPENEMEICKHTLLMMLENINNRRDKNDKNTAFTSETI